MMESNTVEKLVAIFSPYTVGVLALYLVTILVQALANWAIFEAITGCVPATGVLEALESAAGPAKVVGMVFGVLNGAMVVMILYGGVRHHRAMLAARPSDPSNPPPPPSPTQWPRRDYPGMRKW